MHATGSAFRSIGRRRGTFRLIARVFAICSALATIGVPFTAAQDSYKTRPRIWWRTRQLKNVDLNQITKSNVDKISEAWDARRQHLFI